MYLQPGKSNLSSSNGGGQKDRVKKRVRLPNDKQVEIIGEPNSYKNSSGIIGYDPALVDNYQPRPNSIEVKRSYPNHQSYQYTQEPIYTPRILRSEQPPSPQRQIPSQQQMFQDPPPPPHQIIDAFALNPDQGQLTPTRRPNQPPPAPPPVTSVGLNDFSSQPTVNNRDSLPPPPPLPEVTTSNENGIFNHSSLSSPMHQNLMSQIHSQLGIRNSPANDSLPPPPPVPVTSNFLGARAPPPEHLAPSPPPPPPPPIETTSNGIPTATLTQTTPAVVPPPPPPPPPPPTALTNGVTTNGDVSDKKVKKLTVVNYIVKK